MKIKYLLFFSCNILLGMQQKIIEKQFTINEKLLAMANPIIAPYRKELICAIVKELDESNKTGAVKALRNRLKQENTFKEAFNNWLEFYTSKTALSFNQFDPGLQEDIKRRVYNNKAYVWLTQIELEQHILRYLNYHTIKPSHPFYRGHTFYLSLHGKNINDHEGLLHQYAFNLLYIDKAFQEGNLTISKNNPNRIVIKNGQSGLAIKLFECGFNTEV